MQYLGFLLVLVSWLGGYALITKYHHEDLTTISKHAASNKQAFWRFALALVALGGGFYIWLSRWFAPHLHLGGSFQWVLALTIAGQIVAAVVPDVPGWRRKVHVWAAFGMAILYLPLGALIAASSELGLGLRLLCATLLIYMLSGFVLVAMMGRAKPHYLFLQASYIMAFQLIILIAAYLR